MAFHESKTGSSQAKDVLEKIDLLRSEDFDGGSPLSFDQERATSYQDSIQCPPHTTPRKLALKVDFHVVPFLCILYLLAFLDR